MSVVHGVHVQIDTQLKIDEPLPSHIALFNPEKEQVLRLLDAAPGVFIFIFLTGEPSAVSDFSDLPKSRYLASPIWLSKSRDGCLQAAHQIIEQSLLLPT